MTLDRASIHNEFRLIEGIDASIIAAIDRRRATHRTISCNHVTQKMQYGAHRPQDFIFSIINIRNTTFMLNNIIGHYLT